MVYMYVYTCRDMWKLIYMYIHAIDACCHSNKIHSVADLIGQCACSDVYKPATCAYIYTYVPLISTGGHTIPLTALNVCLCLASVNSMS